MTVISHPACWENLLRQLVMSLHGSMGTLGIPYPAHHYGTVLPSSSKVDPQGLAGRGWCAVLCRAFAHSASRLIPWRSFNINMAGNTATRRHTHPSPLGHYYAWHVFACALCVTGLTPFSRDKKPRLKLLLLSLPSIACTALFWPLQGCRAIRALGLFSRVPIHYPREQAGRVLRYYTVWYLT